MNTDVQTVRMRLQIEYRKTRGLLPELIKYDMETLFTSPTKTINNRLNGHSVP